MQNQKNSNLYQARLAAEQVRRYQQKQAAKTEEPKSLTFRPRSGKASVHKVSVEVPGGAVGLIIGAGGKNIKALIAAHDGIKVKGPRRDAVKQIFRITGEDEAAVDAAAESIRQTVSKWESRSAQWQSRDLERSRREKQRKQDWATHIQDISGCEGAGWKTQGDADTFRKQQLSYKRRQEPAKQVKTSRNPFDMGSDSDSDGEEEVQRGPEPCEAIKPKGAWAGGASAAVVQPPTLERQTAQVHDEKTEEDENRLTMEKLHAMHEANKGKSWADMCDSDDDEE